MVQTLIFHTVMSVYGFLTLIYDSDKIKIASAKRDFSVVAAMTVWAVLGNYVYNGTSEGYSHFFNWFFVVRDPFYAIPETIAPFIMPILNIVLFFVVEILLHLVICIAKRTKK